MERWAGKVAVVTGASVGIGAAIVNKLLDNGLIVVGLARRVEKIKELTDDHEAKLHGIECDVTNEENVITAFAWIKENLGSIDVLVNNAGITKESSLSEGSLDDWRSIIDVNVLGLCVCTREAVRFMRESDKTKEHLIIHVSSLAGERVPNVPGFNVYPATKKAISVLAQTLRHELAAHNNIRISTISPGLVATELMANFSSFTPEILMSLPVLFPNDVAEAVGFIMSLPSHVAVQDISLRAVSESW
ncbi:farnesol dehydrogenase [Copidosoma floridanum]|uniref:farnesol dehydrogenase n=1 Tax=Copidosoma floridanum TaxID=29053 RepID=UPI0006C9E23C|nr:farnesol dehydrogenase [Copidosoma floridanum]